MNSMSVLLLASKGEEAERIASFCRKAFSHVSIHHGDWGEPLPEECLWWRGELIVSYCSRWIVPKELLARADKTINFHPGPPEFPGVGGLNWALYEGSGSFGVTGHEMLPDVDAGRIYAVQRFSVFQNDDVESLFSRTHAHLEVLAYNLLSRIATGQDFPESVEHWTGVKRTRRDLNELARIESTMTINEVKRRVRATNFRRWKPVLHLGEMEFELRSTNET